jgi:hypothetical protein
MAGRRLRLDAGGYLPAAWVGVLGALLLSATALAEPPPPLKTLQGWQPGAWTVTPVGSGGPGRGAQAQCLRDPVRMLTGGRSGGACRFSVHSDNAEGAALTWRCDGGPSGRTELRRDAAGLYTVWVHGLEQGQPFELREEWRRTGAC